MIAVRIGDGAGAVPIDLGRRTRDAIREEAAYRKVSPALLVRDLLDAIARGDQFADVLNHKGTIDYERG